MAIGLTIALILFYLFIIIKQFQFLLCLFGPFVVIVGRFYDKKYSTLEAANLGATAAFFGYVGYVIISVFLTHVIYTCPSRHCGLIFYPVVSAIISMVVNLLFNLDKK